MISSRWAALRMRTTSSACCRGGDGLTGDADDALYGDYGEGTAACDEADELLGLTYCSASRHSDLTNAIRDLAENAGQMAGSAGKGAAGEGA